MRAAGVLGVVAGLALLVSACGGSPATTTTTQESAQVAFAHCMRSNGVSSFPDPGANGVTPKETLTQLGVSSARFQAAQHTCRHLLPNGGRPPDRAAQERAKAQALAFSRCIRAHGVTNFPDPDSTGRIPDPASVGVDQGSPTFEAANTACGRDRPPYMPSNAAYNAYARSHR